MSTTLSPCARRMGLMLALCCAVLSTTATALQIDLTEQQAETLGRRIWHNEAAGRERLLTWWNEGEDFASLGIGHFIWYPPGREGPFRESFPGLLRYLDERNVALPAWLARQSDPDCPWPDRASFMSDLGGERLSGLRRLLAGTVGLQARYIVARLREDLPRMLQSLPAGQREAVRARIQALAASPQGLFALIDYSNFKGTGVSPEERYQGQGWGLLQVLQHMRDGPWPAVRAFSISAIAVLVRRVDNAPPERREGRWLPGWIARVQGYARDAVTP